MAKNRIKVKDNCCIVTCLYANNGLEAARDTKQPQTLFDILMGLFDGVGLKTNTKKAEVMVYLL